MWIVENKDILIGIIGWIMVLGFLVTFILTLLGLIGKVKISEYFLKRLFVALILETIGACFHLFLDNSHNRYTSWETTVEWNETYADTLFNFQNKTKMKYDSNFTILEPISEGKVIFLFKNNIPSGSGVFTTKNNGETNSKLYVEISNIILENKKLVSFELKTAIRQKVKEFSYGPFQHYKIIINGTINNKSKGIMNIKKTIANREILHKVGNVIMTEL